MIHVVITLFAVVLIVLILECLVNRFDEKWLQETQRLHADYWRMGALNPQEGSEEFKSYNAIAEEFFKRKDKMVKLFKKAGLPDAEVVINVPTGYGYIQPESVSLFQNSLQLGNLGHINIPETIQSYLIQSSGVFRERKRQVMSPLYWYDCVKLTMKSFILKLIKIKFFVWLKSYLNV